MAAGLWRAGLRNGAPARLSDARHERPGGARGPGAHPRMLWRRSPPRGADELAAFQTTRWSLIVAARGATPDARDALDLLCRAYRPAVISYLRRYGYARPDAEDVAQDFFTRFVEKRFQDVADPQRGRFRMFLRTALRHFVASAHAHDHAARRRPLQPGAGLDPEQLDSGESPERAFERAWALTVLGRALERLRDEAVAAEKLPLFERLRGFLVEAPEPRDYERVAADLDMRPNTVAVATHRLRERLRELVRAELSDTVAGPNELAEELVALRAALEGPAVPALLER